jgi:hypothetical protein
MSNTNAHLPNSMVISIGNKDHIITRETDTLRRTKLSREEIPIDPPMTPSSDLML